MQLKQWLEKFIDLNAIRKKERFEINDLSIYFEKLEEIKTKLIRAGINEIENKKFKQKVGSLTNHQEHWSRIREKKLTLLKMKDITAKYPLDIKRKIRKYHEKLCVIDIDSTESKWF